MSQHPTLRIIELNSHVVFETNEVGEWINVEDEPSVSDKFNKWLDDNDSNPAQTPTITTVENEYKLDDGRIRVIRTKTLCAVVINRKVQFETELMYRRYSANLNDVLPQQKQTVTTPVVTKSVKATMPSPPPRG